MLEAKKEKTADFIELLEDFTLAIDKNKILNDKIYQLSSKLKPIMSKPVDCESPLKEHSSGVISSFKSELKRLKDINIEKEYIVDHLTEIIGM